MVQDNEDKRIGRTALSDTAVDDTVNFDPSNPTKGISEEALNSFLEAHPEYR